MAEYTVGPGGDFSSLAAWEAWIGQQGQTGPQGQIGQVGYYCKEPKKHRLYHAIGVDCPCIPKHIYVPQIPTFKCPTITLDDVKNRRFNIIDRHKAP